MRAQLVRLTLLFWDLGQDRSRSRMQEEPCLVLVRDVVGACGLLCGSAVR